MKNTFLSLSIILGILLSFSALYAQNPVARTEPAAQEYKVGELVEAADYRGVWYKSKIADVDADKYRVHFFGFDAAWDEWVTSEKIRYSEDYDFGREVEVEQNGVWYKALIVDSRFNTEHLVTYIGYNEDEWVKDERIRENGAGWSGVRHGRTVEVAYGKGWRRAQILKRRFREVYVHYEGESDIWNTWVSVDKVRGIR